MQKNFNLSRLLEFNIGILLISTSGALGRYVTLLPEITIFWRALLASLFIFIFCKLKGLSFKTQSSKDSLKIIVGGILMGLHWVTYFYSLRLSNVAIGMLSIFTYPVITSLLEPIILKTKFKPTHLLLSILVLVGIYFLVPDFNLDNKHAIAVGYGVFSALCYSLRNIIMKEQVTKYNGLVLMFYQTFVITIGLCSLPFIYGASGLIAQWKPLLTLALLTTCIGHTIFLMSFRHFSITTASIMSSSQPVFGIILGIIFLNEYPSLTTIIGGVLIVSAVVIESIKSYKTTNMHPKADQVEEEQ
jgi:drug/metabolite transporter (DMT)-like permease